MYKRKARNKCVLDSEGIQTPSPFGEFRPIYASILETEFYRLAAHSSTQVRAGARIASSGQNRGTEADLLRGRALQMFALSPLLDKLTGEGTKIRKEESVEVVASG